MTDATPAALDLTKLIADTSRAVVETQMAVGYFWHVHELADPANNDITAEVTEVAKAVIPVVVAAVLADLRKLLGDRPLHAFPVSYRTEVRNRLDAIEAQVAGSAKAGS